MDSIAKLTFTCPFCRDKEGRFAKVYLYIPEDDEDQIATQCNCTGEEDRCILVLNLIQSYNAEQMLKKIIDKK